MKREKRKGKKMDVRRRKEERNEGSSGKREEIHKI